MSMHRSQFSEAIPASLEASGSSTSLLLVCFLHDRLSLVVGEGGSHEPYFFWMIFDLCVQYTLGMTTLHLDIVLSLVSWPGGEVVTYWRTCILFFFLNAAFKSGIYLQSPYSKPPPSMGWMEQHGEN